MVEDGFSRFEFFQLIKNMMKHDIQEIYAATEKLMSHKQSAEFVLSTDNKKYISKLVYDIRVRWEENNRFEQKFLTKNEKWLQKYIVLKDRANDKTTNKKKEQSVTGRPSIDFSDSSDRSKRRKTQKLREEVSTEKITFAAKMKLRDDGKYDAAKVLQDITEGSPSKATKYRKSLETTNTDSAFTADEALSLFVELGLSKNKYQQLRNACMLKKSKIIPSYKQLSKAKKNCYPSAGICINLDLVEVKLNSLLDHTVGRIIQHQMDVMKILPEKQLEDLTLICKWGCDGSSGHNEFKHKLDDTDVSDTSIFFTSFVPLQLVHVNKLTKTTTIVWKNPRPSSPRYCRPVKIEFGQESVNLTKKTVDDVQQQIKNLTPFETTIAGKKVSVTYNLSFTMIDTKVCNSLTNTSSAQRCYLCQLTSKNFNNIDEIINIPIVEEHLKFGLSSLHCWIRCFEFVLHLSYKLENQKWQARKEEEKKTVEKRKENMQKAFKKELGLNVDKPKAGSGTSNDGNTARRFFENYKKSAQITGVDEDIIYRFYVILQTISCGHDISEEKFNNYALELAKKLVQLYPWYYMPTLVHKLLIHGSEIIKHSILPIGQMSEEAQESCNKFFKIYRENFARKSSRQKMMQDIFYRFLVASDPCISSCRKLPRKPLRSLSVDVINLLSPSPAPGSILEENEVEFTDDDSSTCESSSCESYDEDENFLL